MSSFRQLTVGFYGRPATDTEQFQPSTPAAAAGAAAGEFLSVYPLYCLLSV